MKKRKIEEETSIYLIYEGIKSCLWNIVFQSLASKGRHGKTFGSGQSRCRSNGSRVILSGLETGSGQSG